MSDGDHSETVLVWAPRGRDAALTVRLLERHGLAARECKGLEELISSIESCGCAVLTAESLTHAGRDQLAAALARQPPWSDFPLVLFAPSRADVADRGLQEVKSLGNVAILERPVQPATLTSSVLSALRGRRRQYEARDAIHRRDQFLAMLGHELRNPLAAITLALETMPANDSPSRQRVVIERQATHLSRLVDDLLDVARVTSGKVRLEREPVDLVEVVRRCVHSAELVAAQRQITMELEAPGETPVVVEADLVRLEEIFTNLVSNALKYSAPKTRVTLRVQADATTCRVDITDQGIGISAEMLPRVFELFTQAEGSLARSQGGLGIGLTLVKSLVELHGGSISAASPGLEKGSTFSVVLPRSNAVMAPSEPAPAPKESSSLRVVLIDDNADVLEMTKELLELHGCEVVTAPDGPSGLDLLIARQPDIAFIDIGLPGIDGFEVAERARASQLGQTYLVAMTGYGQPEDRQRAMTAGFDKHLTKPVTFAALRDALDSVRRVPA